MKVGFSVRRLSTACFGHLWSIVLPIYLLASATFNSTEVTNAEYLKFVVATRAAAPEYWINGRIPSGKENDAVVLINFHEAAGYCRFIGQRLPTMDEWKSTCESNKLKKRGDIWEWTSTDVGSGGETYKAMCGPANTCDCSHRYLPHWKNGVKGFRCVQDQTPVSWLIDLIQKQIA
ncbi:MAG: hypothetical protein FJ143_15630 [Deltaproteobacteria bacterium]|nr:hypothetical protein [Deltaproteobacteria bacterium]MBM4299166.1 hypothetical protein [Deltaproteobacteria bacterium]